MKPSSIAVAGAALQLVFTSPVLADAATHEFRIETTKAYANSADCGGGQCSDACEVTATLSYKSGTSKAEIAVELQFVNPSIDYSDMDPKFSVLSFSFLPPPDGEKPLAQVDHVLGMTCDKLKVDKVAVTCFENCGFVYVAIPEYKPFGLTSKKIQASYEE